MTAAILLVFATATVFYILIGYPLFLALRQGRQTAVRKDPEFRTTVSTILAVHNGADFIRAKLESLLGLNYPGDLHEVLVVSDGSTDGTDTIVEAYAGRGVRLLRVPRGGKAAALNEGMAHARGEILFFTDVRQIFHPDALRHLVANFADPSIGVVSGELRFLNPAKTGEQADVELYWRYEVWARRRHSQIDSQFGATGCIYAMRRSLAQPIPADTLVDDVLIPVRVFFQGYRVVLDPEAIAYDYPTPEGGEFRRKLRTLAGLWQVHIWTPRLFTRANRMRFHFLSHKSARLILPWAMLVGVGATIALPGSAFRTVLLIAEAGFGFAAAVDRLIPRGFALKRISSPARSFLALNTAALLSVVVFVAPPRVLWRPAKVTRNM